MRGTDGQAPVFGAAGAASGSRTAATACPARPIARAGRSAFEEFLDILAAEGALDGAPGGPEPDRLPRAFGGYTLEREIGRGALGVVFEAVRRDSRARVALKVLLPYGRADAGLVERFRREPLLCAGVRHDHVVRVRDAGDVDGVPYYAMDLLRGESLAARIRAGRMGRPADTCRLLAPIADALDLLHRAGVVHRDVSPSNIVVRDDGRAVLADFGLARVAGSVTSSGAGVAGTPLYMSPEQLLGGSDAVDARTDVYGLGATLYEALAGRPVFAAVDLESLVREIRSAKPRPLRDFAPDVPAACEVVVAKALEKRREDRHATAADLRDDLLAVAAGGAVRDVA